MAEISLKMNFVTNFSYAEMKLISFALQGRKMNQIQQDECKELAKKIVKRQAEELKHYMSILDAASNELEESE